MPPILYAWRQSRAHDPRRRPALRCFRPQPALSPRGVRPAAGGPRQAADWPELTESEFAVVSLVARGATNREVAERLFLSPYTVSSHLRHVFAKLGIRSRAELAHIATARGGPILERIPYERCARSHRNGSGARRR